MNFKEWLLVENQEGGKTGLYPLGYAGIGLYPPQTYLTRSADAIFYLSIDDRIYKNTDKSTFDITHLPGKNNNYLNKGDGGIWNITHLKGRPSHTIGKNYATKNGEKDPWKINHIKGNVTYKKHKEYIPDSGDRGGIWDISHIKK